jgi:hypothetical protein
MTSPPGDDGSMGLTVTSRSFPRSHVSDGDSDDGTLSRCAT